MAESTIEWTDKVWNPVRGCVKISAGCKNCYAETFAERWRGVKGHPYEQGFDLRLVPEKLEEPLRWQKAARVFVNSMSDLFQDGVPDEFIDKVFAVMALSGAERYRCHSRKCDHDGFDCEDHGTPTLEPVQTFQILTKRAERMRAYLNDSDTRDRVLRATRAVSWWDSPEEMLGDNWWPLKNVWLGVSVENQEQADNRIPILLQTPAAVRWISAEPLLGQLDLNHFFPGKGFRVTDDLDDAPDGARLGRYERAMEWWNPVLPALDWVVVGGESGHGARPFCIDWADEIVRDAQAASVPIFVKQLGRRPVTENVNRWDLDASFIAWMRGAAGAEYKLSDPKGGEMHEWPMELRVREFPVTR